METNSPTVKATQPPKKETWGSFVRTTLVVWIASFPALIILVVVSSFFTNETPFIVAGLIFQFVVLMGVPVYIFIKRAQLDPIQYLRLSQRPSLNQLLWVTLLTISTLVLSILIVELTAMLPIPEYLLDSSRDEFLNQVPQYMRQHYFFFLIGIFTLSVLPGIFEEILFRGTIQKLFCNTFKNPMMSILISASIFSIAHFSAEGIFSYLFMGVVLGYLYFWTKNLWLSIYMHMLNNAIAISIPTLLPEHYTTEIQNYSLFTWSGLFMVVLALVAFYFTLKHMKENS